MCCRALLKPQALAQAASGMLLTRARAHVRGAGLLGVALPVAIGPEEAGGGLSVDAEPGRGPLHLGEPTQAHTM